MTDLPLANENKTRLSNLFGTSVNILAMIPQDFFRGSVLGQDTSEPLPSTGETQERHE